MSQYFFLRFVCQAVSKCSTLNPPPCVANIALLVLLFLDQYYFLSLFCVCVCVLSAVAFRVCFVPGCVSDCGVPRVSVAPAGTRCAGQPLAPVQAVRGSCRGDEVFDPAAGGGSHGGPDRSEDQVRAVLHAYGWISAPLACLLYVSPCRYEYLWLRFFLCLLPLAVFFLYLLPLAVFFSVFSSWLSFFNIKVGETVLGCPIPLKVDSAFLPGKIVVSIACRLSYEQIYLHFKSILS